MSVVFQSFAARLPFFLIAAARILIVYAGNEIQVLSSLHKAYPDWKPRGIVDVGANVGGWTRAVQKEYPSVRTFMVEASLHHAKKLEETKNFFGPHVVEYEIALLSSTDGDTVNFYSNPGEATGNSMFAEQTKHYEETKPELRTTSKLDTIVKHMDQIDYLKLDVQGGELMVLSGGMETLNRTTFVQLEVSIVEYNKGGACWYEIDEFLRQHGFYLYDSNDYFIETHLFNTKAIGQFDVLYIRPSSDFMPRWLMDSNVQFCGSNREKEIGSPQVANNATIMDIDTAGIMHINKMLIVAIAFSAFVVGYLVGSSKREAKHLTRKQ